MKKPTTPEKHASLIAEIEAACSGTAWEATVRDGWDADSLRFGITLTNEAIHQQYERQGAFQYAPAIYFDEDYLERRPWRFKIQTTSYGALTTDEIQKFTAAYVSATALVRRLTAIIKAYTEA